MTITEILRPIFKKYYKQPKYFPDEFIAEALQSLYKLIDEEVIGQDEPTIDDEGYSLSFRQDRISRNRLKTEQRAALRKVMGI